MCRTNDLAIKRERQIHDIARSRSQHAMTAYLRTLFEFDTTESLALYLETSDDNVEPSLIRGSGCIIEA